MPDEGESRFRRWLVDKVKRARWVTYTADTVDAVARRIGVQADVITQAQRELSEERRAEGKVLSVLGTGRTQRRKKRQVDIDMPKDVHHDWLLYCKTRDLPGSVVIRSLIQTLLSGPENPQWIGRQWRDRARTVHLQGYKEDSPDGLADQGKTDRYRGGAGAAHPRA